MTVLAWAHHLAAVQCGALQYSVVQCSAVQCSAVQCRVQCTDLGRESQREPAAMSILPRHAVSTSLCPVHLAGTRRWYCQSCNLRVTALKSVACKLSGDSDLNIESFTFGESACLAHAICVLPLWQLRRFRRCCLLCSSGTPMTRARCAVTS